MSTIDVNKCLVEKGHIGYTEFYNVCTHQVQDVVPWAPADYAGFSVLILVLVILAAAIVLISYCVYDMSK